MKTYTINLARAHILIQRAQQKIRELAAELEETRTLSIQSHELINWQKNQAAIVQRAEQLTAGNQQKSALIAQLLAVSAELKQQINQHNAQSGISTKMTEIKNNERYLQFWTREADNLRFAKNDEIYTACIDEKVSALIAHIPAIKDDATRMAEFREIGTLEVNLFAPDALSQAEQKVQYYQRTNQRLADEIKDANGTTRFAIALDDAVAELLALI